MCISSYIESPLGHFAAQVHPEKNFYIFSKKKNIFFGKWNFLALRLKKFLYFLKKSFSYISGRNFSSSKNKKQPPWKKFLHFGKWNFLALRLKAFLYFKGELAKLKNNNFLYWSKKVLLHFGMTADFVFSLPSKLSKSNRETKHVL